MYAGEFEYFELLMNYRPSKSQRHTDLKNGVTIGNILGLIALIIVCGVYSGVSTENYSYY